MTKTVRSIAFALTALSTIGAAALSPAPVRADVVAPPRVPAEIQVPPGNVPFLVGHASGTQNYVCLPSGGAFAWTLFTPQAALFGRGDRQVTTHFFGPNPEEGGTVRPAWRDSSDTSTVWAKPVRPSTDPAFVAPNAVPWVLLEKTGAHAGPAGGGTLIATTYVQRINTTGGVAPATGCAATADVGAKAFVPYTADYVFFAKRVG